MNKGILRPVIVLLLSLAGFVIETSVILHYQMSLIARRNGTEAVVYPRDLGHWMPYILSRPVSTILAMLAVGALLVYCSRMLKARVSWGKAGWLLMVMLNAYTLVVGIVMVMLARIPFR